MFNKYRKHVFSSQSQTREDNFEVELLDSFSVELKNCFSTKHKSQLFFYKTRDVIYRVLHTLVAFV